MSFPGAEKLLDFAQPFDVPMLDQIIGAFYTPGADPSMVRRRASARHRDSSHCAHGRGSWRARGAIRARARADAPAAEIPKTPRPDVAPRLTSFFSLPPLRSAPRLRRS